MPIKSTKPPAGRFNASPEPLVTQAQFKKGENQLEGMLPTAKTRVNKFNTEYLALTQPYARVAELRRGDSFRRQQEAAMRAELAGAMPFPRPRVGNIPGGMHRSRPLG